MFEMSSLSPSGGGGGPGHPPSSIPLSFQTIIDHVPRPYRPNIFDEPSYSYLRALNIPQMVEIFDSFSSKSSSASGVEECGTSSRTPVDEAWSPQKSKKKEVGVLEGSWSFDEVKSRITQADLNQLWSNYSVPDDVTLQVPEDKELPHSPPVGEVSLNRWFFKCGLKLQLPHFVRCLLHDVRLVPLQLNPNTWKGIYCCYVLWRKHIVIDPSPAKIQACFKMRSATKKVRFFCYCP